MNPAPERIRSLLFAPASKPDVLRKLPDSPQTAAGAEAFAADVRAIE